MTAKTPFFLLVFLLAAFPAEAGLHAQFKDTVEEEIAAFRTAIDDNVLDDDAYFTLVIGLELKGALDGDSNKFGTLLKTLLKPGDNVAYHRLAAALRHRGHKAEAAYVDNEAEFGGTGYVVNSTVS